MLLEMFEFEELLTIDELEEFLGLDPGVYDFREMQAAYSNTFIWEGILEFEGATYNKIAILQYNERLVILDFLVPEAHKSSSQPMFEQIVYSVSFK